jgi:hypothetical protein
MSGRATDKERTGVDRTFVESGVNKPEELFDELVVSSVVLLLELVPDQNLNQLKPVIVGREESLACGSQSGVSPRGC